MALLSAAAAIREDRRWCLCRPCVYGFGIFAELDGGEPRVCGEACAVGRPVSDDAGGATAAASAPAAAAPLCCNICGTEVDLSSSAPCVSDDDAVTSSDN
ncbi:hypothetical protein ACHAXT_007440 [Thalassiosira profunda]